MKNYHSFEGDDNKDFEQAEYLYKGFKADGTPVKSKSDKDNKDEKQRW